MASAFISWIVTAGSAALLFLSMTFANALSLAHLNSNVTPSGSQGTSTTIGRSVETSTVAGGTGPSLQATTTGSPSPSDTIDRATSLVNVDQWIPLTQVATSTFQIRDGSVYAGGKSILNADPTSFLVSYANTGDILDFAKDKNHVFDIEGNIYNGIDSGSFSVLNLHSSWNYAKDKNHAYWFTWQDWGIIKDADPGSFTIDKKTLPFAKDASHVFYGGHALAQSDQETFALILGSEAFAKDKNQVYFYGNYPFVSIVQGADPNTFGLYKANSRYGKDKTNVFCDFSILSGADVTSFQLQPNDWRAKDNYNTYAGCSPYNGKP